MTWREHRKHVLFPGSCGAWWCVLPVPNCKRIERPTRYAFQFAQYIKKIWIMRKLSKQEGNKIRNTQHKYSETIFKYLIRRALTKSNTLAQRTISQRLKYENNIHRRKPIEHGSIDKWWCQHKYILSAYTCIYLKILVRYIYINIINIIIEILYMVCTQDKLRHKKMHPQLNFECLSIIKLVHSLWSPKTFSSLHWEEPQYKAKLPWQPIKQHTIECTPVTIRNFLSSIHCNYTRGIKWEKIIHAFLDIHIMYKIQVKQTHKYYFTPSGDLEQYWNTMVDHLENLKGSLTYGPLGLWVMLILCKWYISISIFLFLHTWFIHGLTNSETDFLKALMGGLFLRLNYFPFWLHLCLLGYDFVLKLLVFNSYNFFPPPFFNWGTLKPTFQVTYQIKIIFANISSLDNATKKVINIKAQLNYF